MPERARRPDLGESFSLDLEPDEQRQLGECANGRLSAYDITLALDRSVS
jgi:hypothetical protein